MGMVLPPRVRTEELKCTAVQSALHLGFGAVYLRSGLGPRTVPLGSPLNKSSGPG